jgi:hypothetical protein
MSGESAGLRYVSLPRTVVVVNGPENITVGAQNGSLLAAVRGLAAAQQRTVVLDLSGTKHADSGTIEELLGCAEALHGVTGCLALVASERVQNLLKVSWAWNSFAVYRDTDSAIRSLISSSKGDDFGPDGRLPKQLGSPRTGRHGVIL